MCFGKSTTPYAVVCTINNDMTITVGTKIVLHSEATNTVSATLISQDKVFIVSSYSVNYPLSVIVCTISNSTITVGTLQKITSCYFYGGGLEVKKLSDNKVIIAFAYFKTSQNYNLYGIICTVSGTNITVGTNTQLSSDYYSAYAISIVILSESKIFIAHSNSTNYYLYGMICTVSGTTITVETDVKLSEQNIIGKKISAVLLEDNRVLIAHGYGDNSYLCGMLCKINDTKIEIEMDVQLDEKTNSSKIIASLLSNNNIFVAYDYSATVLTISKLVLPVTTPTDNIYGVAKDNGTEGDMIDIYRPYKEAIA